MIASVPVDVSTTPRKPLTDRERLELWERCKGICCLCDRPIAAGEKWIDEHKRALGLGGSNSPENRGIAHKACADLKTHGPSGDLAKIAKAKRSKKAHIGIKGAPTSLAGPTHQELRERHALRSKERSGDRLKQFPKRSLYRERHAP